MKWFQRCKENGTSVARARESQKIRRQKKNGTSVAGTWQHGTDVTRARETKGVWWCLGLEKPKDLESIKC